MENQSEFAPLLHDQRLVERVLRHWAEMATGQVFPRVTEIDPWMLAGDWANCAIVRHNPAPDTFMVVGSKLATDAENLTDRDLSAIPSDTVLGMTLTHLQSALKSGAPVKVEGAADFALGVPVLYRSVLMPLSGDSDAVEYVLVAANYRVLAEGEIVPPFSRESIVTR